MPPVLRSILAVIGGFLTMNFIVIVFKLITLAMPQVASGQSSPGHSAFQVGYSFFAATAAGFVCGLIADRRPIEHAAALAAIMLGFGVVSYRHFTGQQPFWYQVMMMVVPPLFVLAGAALFARTRPLSNA